MRWNDWTGLDWTGLDWTGLDWTGLDRTGLDWTGLDWTSRCGAMTVLGLLACICMFALDSDSQLHLSMTSKSIDQFVEIEKKDNDTHGSGTAK
jgi:hypothetical protein